MSAGMTASEFERGFSAGVAWLASEADRAARAIAAGDGAEALEKGASAYLRGSRDALAAIALAATTPPPINEAAP
jgi:hypothetical protein